MAPTHAAAFCCARKGCNGYRFMFAALADNEAVECTKCGQRFLKKTVMMPLPNRAPRDAAEKGKGKGKELTKDKGKGKGNERTTNVNNGGGPSAQARAKAQAKAKPSRGGPWLSTAPTNTMVIDAKRINDPTYFPKLQVVMAEKCKLPDKAAEAREALAAAQAQQEAEMPPERRLTALRKRLRAAEAAENKQTARVQAAEEELVTANTKLHDAKLGLREKKEEVLHITAAIEKAELDIKPAGPPLRPGRVERPPVIEDLMEMLFQAFSSQYELGESGTHLLELPMRQLESLKDRLETNKAEAEWRARKDAQDVMDTKESNKRARAGGENDLNDQSDKGTDTPVAEETIQSAVALQAAIDEAEALAKAQAQQKQARTAREEQTPTPRSPPVDTTAAPPVEAAASSRAKHRERSPRPDPHGEAGASSRLEPASAAGAKTPTEPRTKGIPGSAKANDTEPPRTTEQEAAIRGDSIGSLPEIDAATLQMQQPPNLRGGASLR